MKKVLKITKKVTFNQITPHPKSALPKMFFWKICQIRLKSSLHVFE